MQLDLFRRDDGALVVVPSRCALQRSVTPPPGLRYVRTVRVELTVLGEALVRDLGLHGAGVASGVDAALLRSCTAHDNAPA